MVPSTLSFAVNVPVMPDDCKEGMLIVPYRLFGLTLVVADTVSRGVGAAEVIVGVGGVRAASIIIRKNITGRYFYVHYCSP
jgi:hypothetical protein